MRLSPPADAHLRSVGQHQAQAVANVRLAHVFNVDDSRAMDADEHPGIQARLEDRSGGACGKSSNDRAALPATPARETRAG